MPTCAGVKKYHKTSADVFYGQSHKRRSSTKIRESNRAEEVKLPRKADYYKTLHGVVTNLRTNKIPIMH